MALFPHRPQILKTAQPGGVWLPPQAEAAQPVAKAEKPAARHSATPVKWKAKPCGEGQRRGAYQPADCAQSSKQTASAGAGTGQRRWRAISEGCDCHRRPDGGRRRTLILGSHEDGNRNRAAQADRARHHGEPGMRWRWATPLMTRWRNGEDEWKV